MLIDRHGGGAAGCGGTDGGNTEGAQYWAYGMESFLRFALLLERLTGIDEGLVTHPLIRNALNMVRVSLCNDGALHGVNDTIPMPVTTIRLLITLAPS